MLAAIFGVSGQALTSEERAFFRDVQPLGLIVGAVAVLLLGLIAVSIALLNSLYGPRAAARRYP